MPFLLLFLINTHTHTHCACPRLYHTLLLQLLKYRQTERSYRRQEGEKEWLYIVLLTAYYFETASKRAVARISNEPGLKNPALHHRNELHFKIYSNRKQLF